MTALIAAVRGAALACLLLLVFALPADGMAEVAGMSLVKIAGLLAVGLAMLLVVLGAELRGALGFHLAVLGYVAWALLSYTWTAMPEPYGVTQAVGSGESLNKYLYILVLSFLLFQLITRPVHLRAMAVAWLLGAFWLIFLMLQEYEWGADTVRHHIPAFDANEVSVKLAMVLPLAVWLLQQPHWLWRALALAYFPAAILTILLTGSRTGAVVLAVGLLAFVPLVWRSGWIGKTAAALLLVAGVIAVANVVPHKTIERIFSTGKEVSSGTLNERSVIWGHAYEEWAEQPWHGHGIGSFRRVINPHNVDYTAHNSFVAIAVEQGVVGLLLYIAVLATVAWAAWQVGGDTRWFLLVLWAILLLGQLPLTLQDRMYIWIAYSLMVLHWYVPNRLPPDEKNRHCHC